MQAVERERRSGRERRQATVRALWHGAFQPRRRGGRRVTDRDYPVIDWHSPRVLVLALVVLGLCVLDGVFTILLVSNGATEVNPFMALFLPHELGWFAAVKLTLTSIGLFVLVACNRLKLFRRVSGEWVLLVLAATYVLLIVYQLELLAATPGGA